MHSKIIQKNTKYKKERYNKMTTRKCHAFYLSDEICKQFPWGNKSEFVEIAILFSIDAFNTDPLVQDQFIKLRDLRRDEK